MRTGLIIFLIAIISSTNGQHKNPFATLKFDKIIMYDFSGSKGSGLYIIDENDQLAGSVVRKVELNKNEAAELSSKLGASKSYGGATASCFDPHLGFVYYLKEKVVAHVTICLDCNRLASNVDIPAQNKGSSGEGLSRSFRNYLNELLRANNFSHQINKN